MRAEITFSKDGKLLKQIALPTVRAYFQLLEQLDFYLVSERCIDATNIRIEIEIKGE